MNTPLKIRRIDGRSNDAAGQIQAIRAKLSPSGDMVSDQGRKLTLEVFGSPLTPREVVERICSDVAESGLEAVLTYSRKLDRVTLDARSIRVSESELAATLKAADPEYIATLRRIRRNILTFQTGILHRDAILARNDHELRLLYRPLRRVGVCIPGGAAAYPSTLLMTVVPAQAAGVEQIAVVAPPTRFGANNPDLLAACAELGVREVYRIGGAQGVAALAYGVEGIEPVDKIVGPGNIFVALAKQKVSTVVGIDMLAGPTELVILADASARADYVAADLISQAEHAPGASILITWHPPLASVVVDALSAQLANLDRGDLARASLDEFGAVITVADEEAGCRLSDAIAPEHLQIQTADPESTLARIHHAAAVFLGHYTPVAVGDYVAGPSHTLPTGGTARFASGLSANDFLKRISVIRYSPTKLSEVADDLRRIAAKEGLTGHSRSVDLRLQTLGRRAPAATDRTTLSQC
jgi:histidinol dehydrogenase